MKTLFILFALSFSLPQRRTTTPATQRRTTTPATPQRRTTTPATQRRTAASAPSAAPGRTASRATAPTRDSTRRLQGSNQQGDNASRARAAATQCNAQCAGSPVLSSKYANCVNSCFRSRSGFALDLVTGS